MSEGDVGWDIKELEAATRESRVGTANVAWVWFPELSSNVGWVCWLILHSAVGGLSLDSLVFPFHQKQPFDLICCDSFWFVVSSVIISKATMLCWILWDLNKMIIIIIIIVAKTPLSIILLPVAVLSSKGQLYAGPPNMQWGSC